MRRVTPKLQQWLDRYNQLMADQLKMGFKPTATNAREGLAKLTRAFVTDCPHVAWIQDDIVPSDPYAVPVRIYDPQPDAKLPVLIYYHGGGHMAGSITVYDPICRKLALASRHIVVSVDYRRAPECAYPAAVVDACNVAKDVGSVLDGRGLAYRSRLSIAGDSGGGALCATVAHKTQFDDDIDIRRQVLIYPSLDYTLSMPSVEDNGVGYLLQKDKILWYFDHYFQHMENRRSASPLFMEFTNKLPQTLVVTAEFCPLRDEGRDYLQRIQSTGIYAKNLHFDDMIHAFLNMEDLAKGACETVYRAIGDFLSATLNP